MEIDLAKIGKGGLGRFPDYYFSRRWERGQGLMKKKGNFPKNESDRRSSSFILNWPVW